MDRKSRREQMREWIALGVREGLTYRELSESTGAHPRTLRRWTAIFRTESERHGEPDREEDAFVELIERADPNSSRIEVVLPGERRVVVDGKSIVEALARVLAELDRC